MLENRRSLAFLLVVLGALSLQAQNSGRPSGDCLVPCGEIRSGGPPKDGIPALTEPEWFDATDAWIDDEDIVLGVVRNGEARAVPLAIFFWHEIVNDTIGGERSVITYCPLTGSGLHFDGKTTQGGSDFGVSGSLWNNNLVMYNRGGEESWWGQMSSRAIVGPEVGESLTRLPIVETSWKTWKALHPDTLIISNITGFSRNYTRYPYGDYEELNQPPLFIVPSQYLDSRLPPKRRVLGIVGDQGTRAYPFNEMDPQAVINDVIESTPVLVVYDERSRMALAYNRQLDGESLTFVHQPHETEPFRLLDEQTSSIWNLSGEALSGPLAGQKLEPIVDSYIAFWFAWAAFHLSPDIYEAGSERSRVSAPVEDWMLRGVGT